MARSVQYSALNGEQFKEVWKEELYHRSAKGSQCNHLLGVVLVPHLR
jgi:hypothetical protein